MYGCAPDALILVHLASRTHIEDLGIPILPLSKLIEIYEGLCATIKPAKVCGIALNTYGFDDAQARSAIDDARANTGLPCDDVVRFDPHAFYDAIAPQLADKTAALR